jgi:hypothetical protein
MRGVLSALAVAACIPCSPAIADEDIVLRGMGSYHVGGRIVEIRGKPVREIVRVVVSLPEIGIKSNSHMLMMDRNNAAVADLINDWLIKKGLAE